MIPFDEAAQFPQQISYGFSASLAFNNTIIENGVGVESRVCRWMYPIHTFNVKESIKSRADISAIAAFYIARQGPYRGFRFRDWTDFTTAPDGVSDVTPFDCPMLPTSDPNVWQTAKFYQSGVITKTRILYKPYIIVTAVGSSVVPYYGDTDPRSGMTADLSRGLVTFKVTPDVTPTAGVIFDVPVHFTKKMDPAVYLLIGQANQGSIDDLEITEIKMPLSQTASTRIEVISSTFSYDSGRLNSTAYGGTQDSYPSGVQIINVTGFTNIQFNSVTLDDLCIMVRSDETVYVTRDDNGVANVLVPTDAIFFTANSGDLNPENAAIITDGTHTANLGNANIDGFIGVDPTTYMGVITAQGFTVIPSDTAIPLTTFAQFLNSGIMRFILYVVPIGAGNFSVPSITLT